MYGGRQRAPKPPDAVAGPLPRGDLVADDAPIAPSDIACAVNDLMARHGPMPMASDVGDCLFVAMEIAHTRLAASGYYASMGFGVISETLSRYLRCFQQRSGAKLR